MKLKTCDVCLRTDVPQNNAVIIDGKTYCQECVNATFKNQNELAGRTIVHEADNTICAFCKKDFGSTELPKISHYPVCSDCEVSIKNKTFPTWVKAFLAAVALIVVGSFAWNWSYFMAYRNVKRSNQLALQGDYSGGARLMREAARRVPEAEELQTMASFYHGIALYQSDKPAEALRSFDSCKGKMPDEMGLFPLIGRTQAAVDFDKGDYDAFLTQTRQLWDEDSSSAASALALASAYSCVYVSKNDSAARTNALHLIDKAKQLDSSENDNDTYIQMIRYRLENRKIIRMNEFTQQFPNGWHKNN